MRRRVKHPAMANPDGYEGLRILARIIASAHMKQYQSTGDNNQPIKKGEPDDTNSVKHSD